MIAKAITSPEEPLIHTGDTFGVALTASGSINKSAKADTRASASPPKGGEKASTSVYEQMVVSAFPDAPIMVEIARAESQFRPWIDNESGSSASGLFQILDSTWVGYGCLGDVYDAADNIACARKIYDRRGTKDWVASSYHWDK